MTTRIVWVALIIAAAIGAVLVSRNWMPTGSAGTSESQATQIGAILPLTGDASSYGQDAKAAIEIALEQHRDRHAKSTITCVFEDDQMAASKAVSAINKLIQAGKPIAVVGAFSSSSTLAIAPIAEKNKIVLISPTASSPDISKSGDFIFRNWPSDALEVETMVRSVRTFAPEVKTLALVAVQNDYGAGAVPFVRKGIGKVGLTLVKEEYFAPGTTDFRAMLEAMKSVTPDAIYFIGYYSEVALALRQARDIGLKSRVLSVSAIEDSKLIQVAREAAEGLVYTRPKRSPAANNPLVSDFVNKFSLRSGKEPSIAARQAYDAIRLIIDGIEKGARTSEAIRTHLESVSDFQGAGAVFSFDGNGDAVIPVELATIRNGKFVTLKE